MTSSATTDMPLGLRQFNRKGLQDVNLRPISATARPSLDRLKDGLVGAQVPGDTQGATMALGECGGVFGRVSDIGTQLP